MNIYTIANTIIFIALLAGVVYVGEKRVEFADHLGQVQECVVKIARHEGYAGNPYGKKAWELFAPYCDWTCDVPQAVVKKAYKENKVVYCNDGNYWVK